MVYRFLGDVMMVLHGAFLLFFVVGGFLAWRWRKLIWVHLFIVGWNLTIVILDFDCPLTGSEKYFRLKGGEEPYAGGYINHYLDGRIWPEGATPVAEKVGFVLVVISYLGFFLLRRRSRQQVITSPDEQPGLHNQARRTREESVDPRT